MTLGAFEMEENKDDYLKKKLHIKDRFIRRLETEKRQLEIDNNSLQHRLQHVEYQLNNPSNTRRANEWTGMVKDSSNQAKQESQRIDAVPQTVVGSILTPRFIPFPSFKTSSLEGMKPDLQQNTAANSSQDLQNGQLLNENLEFTLEISYLKARLKSSEAARAVAERKIENLEEKLRQAEELLGRSMSGIESSSSDQAKYPRPPCSSYNALHGDHTIPIKMSSHVYQSHMIYPGKPAMPEPMSCTLISFLDRILRVVLSLDEKMSRQKT